MKEANKGYNIPQEILYTVCLAAWNLCREHINEFANLKGFYTEAYIDSALVAMQSAKQRPDLVQTIAERKQVRINLVNAARKVQANWQVLKLYITKAFDKEMTEIMLELLVQAFMQKHLFATGAPFAILQTLLILLLQKI